MKEKPSRTISHDSDKLSKEQGVLIDCIQCSIIYPDKDRPDCPECHGKKQYFLPAQMLDKTSSQKLVVHELMQLLKNETFLEKGYFNSQDITSEQEKQLKSICLKLLKNIVIYNFDLKPFIADVIRKLD